MTKLIQPLPAASAKDLAGVKAALEAGEAQLARRLAQDLIANRQFSSVLYYALAAAHGACGDWSAFQDSLNQAQTYHGLEIIKDNGGDLLRFQHDLDYALAIAERCWQARVLGPAMVGFGRRVTQDQVSARDIIDHAHAVLALGRLEEARLGLAVVEDLFCVKPAMADQMAVLAYGPDATAALSGAARDWAQPYIEASQASPRPEMSNPPRRGRRLRLGYLISNLSAPGLDQGLLTVLAAHDPKLFEVRIYYDQGSARLDMGEVVLCPIGALEDEDVFGCIANDQIDVLVETSGHLGGGRLAVMAAKAAPVQVSWTPTGLTTGLTSVDYVLLADGTGQAGPQAEARWLLGPVQMPFIPKPDRADKPASGEAQAGHSLGCLAHPSDLDHATLDLFGQVLSACPETRLCLSHVNFRDLVVQNTVCTAFAARGIDPDRLVFPKAVVLSASDPLMPDFDRHIDMMLAPLGGISLSDPDLLLGLSHGIPVLWLASLKPSVPNPLAALGLVEFMATDAPDFVAKAVSWMKRRTQGGLEREALANRFGSSAYANVSGFTKQIELTYCLMFDIWSNSRTQADRGAHLLQWRVPDHHVMRRLA
jgi:hypothetical protein